jgi:hypothetical protein
MAQAPQWYDVMVGTDHRVLARSPAVPQWVYIEIASPEQDTGRFCASSTCIAWATSSPRGVCVIRI